MHSYAWSKVEWVWQEDSFGNKMTFLLFLHFDQKLKQSGLAPGLGLGSLNLYL